MDYRNKYRCALMVPTITLMAPQMLQIAKYVPQVITVQTQQV